MSNQEGFSIGNSFSAFSFVPQNGLTPILDPRTDSPVSNNNNTRKSPRPSASPIGSSNQESFFGGRPWETSAPSTNTGTAKSWGTSGPFQNSTSLLSPSSHISDIWSFSLPTFSSDNTTTAPPPSTFRSLDNTPNNISYSRSPNNNSLPSPRYPTSNSQQQQHSSSFSSVSSGTQAFGRSFTSTPPINEEIINNDDYLGEDISTSPSEYDPTNPSEAFNSLSGEHPLGEHPSRTLFVRNINSNLEDEELSQMFEQYGPIRNMYTQCKHRGFVMISYYDIRHAKNAMRYLQGKLLRKRKLDIHYSIPKDNPSERDQNQGTLVVFNLDPSTSNEELKLIFGQFGEIKEIRETPNKKHHKFIEFFDIRDADKAMKNLNKTDIKGKKIKIEPSRPGGRRTPVPPLPNSNSSNTTTTSNLVSTSAPPVISHHHHLSHSLDNNNNSTLLNSSSYSNTSLLHSNNNNNNINNAMFPHSLPDNEDLFHYNSLPNQFNLMSLNKNNSNSSIHNPSNPFQYSSSDLFGSYSSNYSPPYSGTTPTTNNTSKGLVASSSLGNNPTLANNNSSDYIMRNRSQSFSSADRDLMHQSTATTTASNNNNNIWSDPFSALSPRGGGFNNGSMNSSSSTTTTTTTSFHKVGGFSPPQHLPPHNNTTTTNTVISTTPPTFSDLLFDNNLRSTSPASKSFDGISEVRSRNRSQSIDEDRSKYILSLDRVRNGGDPRTTLMIKNIPNKYSQKMLLATVDEKHKGTYDFFYLPIDFKNKCNVGYAFINFTNPDYIIPFYEDFNNKKWEKFNSEKVCDIAYARIQGKNALISHFQNSSLMVEDKKCRPIIFHDGEPESFPLNNNTVANVASPRRSRSSSFSSQGSRDEDKA